jgi:hypothetical protein
MDRFTSSIESTATSIYDKSKKTLTNEYVLGILVVLAIVYVGALAPKLPSKVTDAMDNIVVKGVMFFLIALGVTRNVTVSIIVSLVVLAIILATQVYLKDDATEHLNSNNTLENGPRNNVRPFSNPAPIMINTKNELIEKEPLGQRWANTVTTFPEGWSNDWDNYEQPAQYEMNIAESESYNNGSNISSQYVSAAMNGQNLEDLEYLDEDVEGVEGVEKFVSKKQY